MNIWKRLLCAALALCIFCCGCAAKNREEEQPKLQDPDPAPVEQPDPAPDEHVLPER